VSGPPVHVVSTTGIWTAVATWLSAGGIGVVMVAIVRQAVPWRKQTDATREQFEARIVARVIRLETQLETERRAHRIEIARLEARAAAQRSLDRHRFANAEGSFDALLILLESAELPERLSAAIAKVREHRFRQRDSEKQESAVIHAAEIEAISKAQTDFDRETAESGKDTIA
jgi:hypothetical protein